MTARQHYEKFWLGLAVPEAKLKFFRFAFFFVFALDAWMQIGSAPRYGFGDFNVSHFPVLDGILPTPTRFAMTVVYGLQAIIGLRIAFGGASRITYGALAVLFAGGYFISQINSFQHHYLLALALGLLTVFPWTDLASQRAPRPKAAPAKDKKGGEGNWPIRMLLVSLSVMYFFAVVTKMDGEWLDGTTLERQINEDWMRSVLEWVGWGPAAKLVILVELTLVFLIHIRRLWPLAIALGLGMHLSFEFSGLKIGLFSYFMTSLYVLLLPDAWVAFVAKRVTPLAEKVRSLFTKVDGHRPISLGIFAGTVALGAALVQTIFIDSVNVLTWGVIALAIADFGLTRRAASAGVKTLLACLILVFFVHSTEALRTYYHFWGHNDRRNKDVASAIIHYENVVSIDPDYASGRRRLGDSYKSSGRREEALTQYEAGLRVKPDNYSLNRSAAQLYHQLGKGPEALAAAKRVLKLKSNDASAKQIRAHWERTLGTDAQN